MEHLGTSHQAPAGVPPQDSMGLISEPPGHPMKPMAASPAKVKTTKYRGLRSQMRLQSTAKLVGYFKSHLKTH